MAYYDLRQFLETLERHQLLHRIAVEVDPAWEVSAICRRVYQRIAEEHRPALLFENLRGSRLALAAGVLGASPGVYALALETTLDQVVARWSRALEQPLLPRLVATGPCQEEVVPAGAVDLSMLPIPIWTVGHDPAPYLTAAMVVSRDPETGVRNVGTYRMQIKGNRHTGMLAYYNRHLVTHVNKNQGKPTPVAVVLGTDPSIGIAAVGNVPYGMDELAVAGGLRGEPVDLVPCKTIPLEVPATAEIVLEGELEVTPELEGPFGEYTGYMGPQEEAYRFRINCLTMRRNAILQAFISQMPPSESSCIRRLGREIPVLQRLRWLGFPVEAVHIKESGGSAAIVIIALAKQNQFQPQEVMWALWSNYPTLGKYVIVVDADIDVYNTTAVEWAVAFRSQPHNDLYQVHNTQSVELDPSTPDVLQVAVGRPPKIPSSKAGIDATRKGVFPAEALPPREHLAQVDQRWQEYGFS